MRSGIMIVIIIIIIGLSNYVVRRMDKNEGKYSLGSNSSCGLKRNWIFADPFYPPLQSHQRVQL